MTEKAPDSKREELEQHHELLHDTPEKATEQMAHPERQTEEVKPQTDIEALSSQAETHAISREVSLRDDQESQRNEPLLGMQQHLKSSAYEKTMGKVQAQLKPVSRSFSKLIHKPAVDAVSDLGAKTVARPAGLLGGGIVALIGSGAILFMAKYYGFTYNFFVYVGLFAGGYIVGVLLELAMRHLRKRKTG